MFSIGEGSDARAALVLSGAKTATSSLPSRFAAGSAPVAGSLSLHTAAAGRPVAIVETPSMPPMSLADIDADFRVAYAEWPDTASFLRGMIEWYRRLDPAFTADIPLLA